MGYTRRQALKALGVAASAAVVGCDDEGGAGATDVGSVDAADAGVDSGADGSADVSTDTSVDGEDGTVDVAPPDPWEGVEAPEYEYAGEPGPEAMFVHGVASGDPLQDAVIVWTCVSPAALDERVDVFWEVALDEGFVRRIAAGTVTTGPERDFTVKVDVTGLREAGRTYWYRFWCQGRVSPVGRTRTAPAGPVEGLRFAFCSCSKYENGYFHAYRSLAEQDDLTAVLHLGDYIYEYGAATENIREIDPPHEIVSLDDYRRRYRHYRKDADLQAMHAAHPVIAVWDDHESTNNSWRDGAQNHQPSEGSWIQRRANAEQAYAEWLPIRDQPDGRIWRRFSFGDLVDLFMLDTRLWGRDAQEEQGGDPSDPDRQILGADQEAWFLNGLSASESRWRVVGQQLPMSVNRADGYVWFGDKWGEYGAARDRVWNHIRAESIDNFVVCTGDVHTHWAMDMAEDPYDPERYDPETGAGAVGVELITGGITSGGGSAPFAQAIGDVIVENNPHIAFMNAGERGYVVVDVARERIEATWHLVDTVIRPEHRRIVAAAVEVQSGVPHVRRLPREYGPA